MSWEKTFFSAILEKGSNGKGYYFKDVRTRNGDILKNSLIPLLTIEDQEKVELMNSDDYVAFVADVELYDIHLCNS